MSRTLRIATVLLLAAFALQPNAFSSSFDPVVPAAAQDAPGDAPHVHVHGDPVHVALALAPAPEAGAVSTLTGHLTPAWDTLGEDEEFLVTLAVPPELEVLTAPQTVTLVQGATTQTAFDLRVLAPGKHRLELIVRRTDPAAEGEMGGDREGWLVVPASGPGAFHPDAVPPTGLALRAVPAAQPMPAAALPDAAAALAGASLAAVPAPAGAEAAPSPPDQVHADAFEGDAGDAAAMGGGDAGAEGGDASFAAQGEEAGDGGVAPAMVGFQTTQRTLFQDPFNQASLDTSKWSVVDSPYSYGMASSSLRITVQELGNNYGEIRSIAVTKPFNADEGIDATLEMQRNVAGSGWVSRPAFRFVRSDNVNVWVDVVYNPFYNRVELRDSAGNNNLIAATVPTGFHTVQLVITGTFYRGTYDGISVEVASTLFNNAPGFRVSLNDFTGGSTSGATETSARRNLVVKDWVSPTFKVRACWRYEDESSTSSAQTYQPQRWATWQVWESDEGWNNEFWYEGITQDDGCFTSPAIPRVEGGRGNQDIYLKFILCNSAACVRHMDSGLAGASWTYETDWETVGDENVMVFNPPFAPDHADAGATRIFQYLNNAYAWASSNGLSAATSMRADAIYYCDGLCQDGASFYALPYCAIDQPPACLATQDTMYLHSSFHNKPDLVVHEWGHFVMDRAYNDNWPTSDPYHPHGFCTEEELPISWQEGWADFVGARMNKEFAGAPGVTRNYKDNYYSSDYRGNTGSPSTSSAEWHNMEVGNSGGTGTLDDSNWCTTPTGDDVEGNIARTLWDFVDVENDGSFDTYALGLATVWDVLNDCDDTDFYDYYNGNGCDWSQQGYSDCAFVRVAHQNKIDYNNPPSASLTTQSSYAWHRGVITLSGALGADPEGCTTGMSAVFRVSGDSTCDASDALVGTDTTSPYSRTYDTAFFGDDASVWTCIGGSDGMETAYSASASSIGIDNTLPVTTASRTCATPGSSGWCRGTSADVTLSASDAMSGLATSSCVWDGAATACGTSTKTFQGTKSGSASGTDLAGNSGSSSVTVRIDGVDPTTSVSVPATVAVSYTVSWSASDLNSGLTGTLTLRERNVDLGGTTNVCSQAITAGTPSTSSSCTRGTTTGPALPGHYCYSIVVSDVAGNTATSAESCTTKV